MDGGERVRRIMKPLMYRVGDSWNRIYEAVTVIERDRAAERLVQAILDLLPESAASDTSVDPGLLLERVAQLTAHRACGGGEHDPQASKLHGHCVVCIVPWPCEYAGNPPKSVAADTGGRDA